MKYKLIIFDCDGTLINTADDVTLLFNAALSDCGFPSQDNAFISSQLGKTLPDIVGNILPTGHSVQDVGKVATRYRELYAQSILPNTKPFPGIKELVDELLFAGVNVAVNSNKPQGALSQLVGRFFPDEDICCEGYIEGRPVKPEPDSAFAIMKAKGATRSMTLYVGDTIVDAQTAANAGIDCLVVSWGQGDAIELASADNVVGIVNDAKELFGFITR